MRYPAVTYDPGDFTREADWPLRTEIMVDKPNSGRLIVMKIKSWWLVPSMKLC
ncbi:hypothetical protein PSTG_17676 [Puccinia striiformis f. sp. tritici PST-78]|uniref:Uncharacterized protein n=1 Tax=Puccinia striiformis f. sp. tritici PST-78 TaxID=1165861 RepID=A0A0L0UPE4_9BASI|nr:hypothetical protein PSTG_17676 [Puccinia striiformis f. sp. tritici PST-78]